MSLSNILKAANSGEKRLIETKMPFIRVEEDNTTSAEDISKKMVHEAKLEAEKQRKDIELYRETTRQNLEKEKALWVEEREEERKRAQETGYNDGFAKGTEESRAIWNNRLNETINIVAKAESDYKDYLEKAEADILNLSIAIAGKIVSEVLDNDPGTWMTLVKNAIKEVRDQETIKIMVAPSRYTEVVEGKEDIQTVSRDARLQIFPDESLGENDCFIETPYGRIDASVDQQFLVIKKALKELLEAGGDEGKGTD
jgi:flagellar assembly protein FliH